MGAKRPFEVDFPAVSLKQPKQFDQDSKIIIREVDFPPVITSPENGYFDDKEETSPPLSWVTSSSSVEETGVEDTTFRSYFPPDFDFSIPFQFPEQLENPYFSSFNCSPRKEVPVGPDHQADVLQWGVNVTNSLQYSFHTDNCMQQKPTGTCTVSILDDSTFESPLYSFPRKEVPLGPDHQAEVLPWSRNVPRMDSLRSDLREQKLMGTCIIPMPDDSSTNGIKCGRGRTYCLCLDAGSMRCVLQHVNEARETFKEANGEEKFSELGFYDMGEEVACKWSANDERLFHEIIFSNPASLGRNFWKHLSAAFPTRTKKEMVSYYFNVFMLRRRAIQNRSLLLEIDSDDDEWKGARGVELYQDRSNLLDSDMDDEDDSVNDDQQDGACDNCCHGRSHILYPDDDDEDDVGNEIVR